jgi:hypothetical protein
MSKSKKEQTEADILTLVKTALEWNDWKPVALEGGPGFVVELNDGAVSRGLAHVLADEHRIVFYAELGERVAAERRLAVAELVTRANYGIIIGNFELDFAEGRLRYKTSLDYEGVELKPQVVRNLTLYAVDGVKPYAAAIADVAAGRKGAAEAIAEVEAGLDVG